MLKTVERETVYTLNLNFVFSIGSALFKVQNNVRNEMLL